MSLNVLVTGDLSRLEVHFLEPGNPIIRYNQSSNIKLLASAIRSPLERALNSPLRICYGDSHCTAVREIVAEFESHVLKEDDWPNRVFGLFAHNYQRIDERLLAPLTPLLEGISLVVGFELSPGMRAWLDRRNLAYLSLSYHPIRFLPDLLFQIVSNRLDLIAAIEEYAITENEIEVSIDSIRAMASYFGDTLPWLPQGTCVIAAQTWIDQTAICSQRFVTLADYLDQLLEHSREAAFTLIVPHPYGDMNYTVERSILKKLGGRAMIFASNAYALLANDAIDSVVSLSSGLGCEARCFNKRVTFLLEDPTRRTRSDATGVTVPANTIRRYAFWSALARAFGHNSAPNPFKEPELPLFRDVIGMSWAYSDLVNKRRERRRHRVLNLRALEQEGSELVRETFRLATDNETPRRVDLEYHSDVIARDGREAFFRSIVQSQPAEERGVALLDI